MEKYIILGTDGAFVIIVHACPNAKTYNYRGG